MKSLFSILLAVTVGSPAFAADSLTLEQAHPVIEKLQKGMASLHSVAMQFTQEKNSSLFVDPLKSEGWMFIEKPDHIRWETTAPYQSMLLGDHKSVAQFEKQGGDWKKLNLGFPQMLARVMDQMTLMHQGKLDALTGDYTVSVNTGAVTSIVLVPKDATVRSLLESIEMQMDPEFNAVHAIVMKEPGGDFTKITMQKEWRDAALPAGTFDQNKPLEISAVQASLNHAP